MCASAAYFDGGGRMRNTLIVVEVALSMVLLVGAGLLMRTVIAMQRVDLGLDPDRILVARVPLPTGQYDTAAAKQKFFQNFLWKMSISRFPRRRVSRGKSIAHHKQGEIQCESWSWSRQTPTRKPR